MLFSALRLSTINVVKNTIKPARDLIQSALTMDDAEVKVEGENGISVRKRMKMEALLQSSLRKEMRRGPKSPSTLRSNDRAGN